MQELTQTSKQITGQKADNVGIKMRQSCVKVSSDFEAHQAKTLRYRFGAVSVVLRPKNLLPHISDYTWNSLTQLDVSSSSLYVVLPDQNL